MEWQTVNVWARGLRYSVIPLALQLKLQKTYHLTAGSGQANTEAGVVEDVVLFSSDCIKQRQTKCHTIETGVSEGPFDFEITRVDCTCTKAETDKMSYYRNWVGLFLLGTINNLPYVIVTSAASTIADSFGKKNLIGLVFGANVALSAVVKTVNGAFMLKVPYWIRYVINAILMLIGLFGVAYAPSFWFSLVCIMCVGASSAFGENVALGYLRLFPSKMVNAWSSGTGMAGVLGSVIYIAFGCVVGAGGDNQVHLRHLTQYAFLLTSPAVAVYLFSYFFIIKAPDQSPTAEEPSQIQSDPEREKLLGNNAVNCADSGKLFAVYLFEYVAQGCAAKVRPKKEYNIGCPELYAALSLCYQAGVFVSRSSVQLVQIRRVEVLSVLQCINMVLWVIDVHYKFIPVTILPALMIYVGLLGGASYVNIFYLLLHDTKYSDKDRELCINITALFITFGIIGGTVLETILFNTALKND